MATKKATNMFAEPVEDADDEFVVQPATVDSNLKRARVKGTWKMYWGTSAYDFQDGKTFHIPHDLYNYLKANGNIYDTL